MAKREKEIFKARRERDANICYKVEKIWEQYTSHTQKDNTAWLPLQSHSNSKCTDDRMEGVRERTEYVMRTEFQFLKPDDDGGCTIQMNFKLLY